MADEFSAENGTLTASMKLRRRVVAERYRQQIEEMYEQAEEAGPATSSELSALLSLTSLYNVTDNARSRISQSCDDQCSAGIQLSACSLTSLADSSTLIKL